MATLGWAQEMKIRTSFGTAILFGIAGWVLMAYPRLFMLYDQVISGEIIRVTLRFLSSGAVDSRTVMVGLSLLPVAPLLFLVALYLEAAGKLRMAVRRIGSGVAGGLMLMTTYWSLMLPFSGLVPGASSPFFWLAWSFNGAVFLIWAVLMGISAVRRTPLYDRITTRVVELIGLLNAIVACAIVASIALKTGFRLSYPVGTAIQIAAPVLIVIFAISTRQVAQARENV